MCYGNRTVTESGGAGRMRYYEPSSRIAAAPDVVWPVLVEAAVWPRWDSGIESVEGEIALGADEPTPEARPALTTLTPDVACAPPHDQLPGAPKINNHRRRYLYLGGHGLGQSDDLLLGGGVCSEDLEDHRHLYRTLVRPDTRGRASGTGRTPRRPPQVMSTGSPAEVRTDRLSYAGRPSLGRT